jgi:hypothetical protein
MLRSYLIDEISEKEMEEAFIKQTNWDMKKGRPYVIRGSEILEKRLESDKIFQRFYRNCWRILRSTRSCTSFEHSRPRFEQQNG